MQLDSYLEIFTTLYGWAFANLIGEIITGTGLAALPFAIIVFKTWHDAKAKGRGFDGVLSLLESIQTRLITALFVMATCFAVTPITSLHNVTLSHTPAATLTEPEPVTVNQSKTNSSYDKAMADAVGGTMSSAGNLSHVPAWWFSVMAISSGVNAGFKAGLSSAAASEIRMVEDIARNATIEDPALMASIQRFYSECFIPARSQYLRTPKSKLSAEGQAIVASSNTAYGPTDVDWMGSQLFRTEPGFYAAMRAYNPVPGWTVDFNRDTEYIQTAAEPGSPEDGYVNPDYGRPTCKQWWEDEAQGVRQTMISHSSQWRALATQAKSFITGEGSDDKVKDAVAKLAQTQARPQYVSPDTILGAQHDAGTVVARSLGGVVSTFNTGLMALVTNISIGPLHNGLMMMQAMTLMAIYMFLPIITFLSGYDLRVMFLGAMAIFTVKFWSVMWYIVNWIDGHMMAAMYPSGSFDVDFLVQMLQNGNKRMLLNILIITTYIALPSIWTGLIGMLGYRSLNAISVLTDATRTANDSIPKNLR